MKSNKRAARTALLFAGPVVICVVLALMLTRVGSPRAKQAPAPATDTAGSQTTSPTVKFGAILPLTGRISFVGDMCRKGLELAKLHQQLADPATRVDLICEDSAMDARKAVDAYRKLKDIDRADGFILTITSVAQAVLSVNPNETAFVSIVSQSDITKGRTNTFRLFLSSEMEARAMAKYMLDSGANTAALLYIDSDFGLDAVQCFKRHYEPRGGTILLAETYGGDDGAIDSLVSKAVAANPRAIYFVGNGRPLGVIAQRLAKYKYTGLRCSMVGFNTPDVVNAAGDTAEGVVLTATAFDPMAPGGTNQTRFAEDFAQKYGVKPDFHAAFLYDLGRLLFQRCTEAKGNIAETRRLLERTVGYEGVVGLLTCGAERDFEVPTAVFRMTGGRAVPVARQSPEGLR